MPTLASPAPRKELYISNSVTRMLYGRTQRNEPSRFLREIEPEYIEETRSPVLEQRSRFGGWGGSYSDTVPGGRSPVTPGRSGLGPQRQCGGSGGYGCAAISSGYLNREYNAGESRGFGSGGRHTGPEPVRLWFRYGRSGDRCQIWVLVTAAYSDGTTQKKSAKQINLYRYTVCCKNRCKRRKAL